MIAHVTILVSYASDERPPIRNAAITALGTTQSEVPLARDITREP